MELLSILNPPIVDILNDPRLTSDALIKNIGEQETAINKQVAALSLQVKQEDLKPFDLMIFALLQHHLHVTNLIAKLAARQMDLTYKMTQLSMTLERLTKWVIRLTIVLAIFAVPLAIDVVLRWLHWIP